MVCRDVVLSIGLNRFFYNELFKWDKVMLIPFFYCEIFDLKKVINLPTQRKWSFPTQLPRRLMTPANL